MTTLDVVLAAVSFAAGLQNALAGGGSFLIFPTLILTGLDPRTANITCTIALFPAQAAAGVAGRRQAAGTASLTFGVLFGISLLGGGAGALLLLHTPTSLFTALVPWLVLFATLVFAWGSFRRTSGMHRHLGAGAAGAMGGLSRPRSMAARLSLIFLTSSGVGWRLGA